MKYVLFPQLLIINNGNNQIKSKAITSSHQVFSLEYFIFLSSERTLEIKCHHWNILLQ